MGMSSQCRQANNKKMQGGRSAIPSPYMHSGAHYAKSGGAVLSLRMRSTMFLFLRGPWADASARAGAMH